MGRIPQVVIVGRPNVGKSTLFNCLLKKRLAIVERFSGVTRDRVSALLRLGGKTVEIVDTGGMGIPAARSIAQKVQAQIETAIESADLLLLVVDANEGLVPLDEEVAERIRRSSKLTVLVANKADNERRTREAAQFYKLGLGEPFPMSAKNSTGRDELLKLLEVNLAGLAPVAGDKPPEVRIAVVGKRNAGKSTLVNALAGAERVIVDSAPGTTRDAVDVPIRVGAKFMVAVDTAGVRKKGKLDDSVEFFSRVRTEQAIRTASVVLLLLDATTKISRVDKKLAAFITGYSRPCVIVVNKWDLSEDVPTGMFGKYVRDKLSGLHYAPIVFTAAVDGTNVFAAIDVAMGLYEQGSFRIGTGVLNRLVEDAVAQRAPSSRKGPRPKVFYATQPQVNPPTIVLFVNQPGLFSKQYLRYLENYFRDKLPYSEIPIRIKLKSRAER